MNKFIIFVVAAFVCGATAGPIKDEPSQLAIFENDDVETSGLSGERQVFKDFCLMARDEVAAHVKNNINEGASNLFKSAAEHVMEAMNKVHEQEKDAVAKGSAMIKEDANNAAKATGGVFNAIVDGVKNGIYEKYEALKSNLNKDTLRNQIFNGCSDLTRNITPKIESLLEKVKGELSATATEDEALKSVIESTNLNNVGCTTTGRIAKLNKSCQKLEALGQDALISLGL